MIILLVWKAIPNTKQQQKNTSNTLKFPLTYLFLSFLKRWLGILFGSIFRLSTKNVLHVLSFTFTGEVKGHLA